MTIFKMTAILFAVLTSVPAFASCDTLMAYYRTSDINLAANYGPRAMDAAQFYEKSFRPEIARLEATLGNLQAIPINVGTAAGTTTMQVSWQSFVISLANKLASSSNRAADVNYITKPLADRAATAATFAAGCMLSDGTLNIIAMIDEAAKSWAFPQFLGKAALYMQHGNPEAPKSSGGYPEIGTVPYSKMPPI